MTTAWQGERRSPVNLVLLIVAVLCLPRPANGQTSRAETIRDRLWIFCCATNSDFPHIGRRSVMSPAEGAYLSSSETPSWTWGLSRRNGPANGFSRWATRSCNSIPFSETNTMSLVNDRDVFL
jgi:hypothetical protein